MLLRLMIAVDVIAILTAIANLVMAWHYLRLIRRMGVLNTLLGNLCMQAFLMRTRLPIWQVYEHGHGDRFRLMLDLVKKDSHADPAHRA